MQHRSSLRYWPEPSSSPLRFYWIYRRPHRNRGAVRPRDRRRHRLRRRRLPAWAGGLSDSAPLEGTPEAEENQSTNIKKKRKSRTERERERVSSEGDGETAILLTTSCRWKLVGETFWDSYFALLLQLGFRVGGLVLYFQSFMAGLVVLYCTCERRGGVEDPVNHGKLLAFDHVEF